MLCCTHHIQAWLRCHLVHNQVCQRSTRAGCSGAALTHRSKSKGTASKGMAVQQYMACLKGWGTLRPNELAPDETMQHLINACNATHNKCATM